jgi:hypothetical protein
MQDEREEGIGQSEEEEVEGHRFHGQDKPEVRIGRTDQESDEDEVEAHRWPHQDKPEEFGKRF